MEKWKQIKIKHHYVWEYYLKNWVVGNNLYWLTSKGKIAHDSPKGLCREDGFYKISTLDKEDVNYILGWSKQSPEYLQKQHKKHLEPFIKISNIIKLIKISNIENDELKRYEDVLFMNTLENLYCGIEAGARNALDGLSKGDLSVLLDQRVRVGLYSYLGHQVTRTKAVKERFREQSLKVMAPSKVRDEAMRLAEKNWWFLCFMLGDNLGFSMYSSRHEETLMLIKNISETPFITSDSPVVNIHPNNDSLPKGEPPEFLDMLFPISPNYILIIAASNKWEYLNNRADIEAVTMFNARIAKNARFSIYGSTRHVVDVNKSKVGAW